MTRSVGEIDNICRKSSYKIDKSHGATYMQSLDFHGPIFWGILFVSNIGLWGVQTVAAECLAHSALL